MFEAYITNAALYPEAGVEVGTTLKFPATTQEVQDALAKIGIDGKQYTEVFFTSFDSDDVLGLYDYLYEYAGIDELNELAHTLLGVRDKGELEKYEAALVLGKHTESVKDLINLAQNLDLYRFYLLNAAISLKSGGLEMTSKPPLCLKLSFVRTKSPAPQRFFSFPVRRGRVL